MFSHFRVRIFIQWSSVKISHSVGIPWKMRWYPVQNHAYFVPVQIIYQIYKIFRCAVSGSWRIIACYLISPGTVKRIFQNTHQFHMGITHFFNILGQRFRNLPVCIKAFIFSARMTFPGTNMHLIDCHWFFKLIGFSP